MGKKTKIGKQRKDRYYQLAKETGYRSRAAFKLIQLNRKFEFLQKSRVCIDLCAAPGGWMQVAKQNMPVSSIVIGVDLFPIKQIPGCISITEDITTDKCRVQLQRELKTWKADVVLNDGAPNVGKNWLHDAYQQSCLTLSALKVATEFLRQGGWFVTKIFRSKDYNPLIWVFKQLFKKVHSTKPQASRSESAEIFVVCQYYIAPHKIDGRFLDAKYVFEELDIGNEGPKINVFHPDKNKAKAIGYPEGSTSLHFPVKATELLQGEPLDILQTASEVVFDDENILNNPLTTAEIKECCKDIRVLGRKDLRGLLNWCKAMKKSLGEKEVEEVKEEKTESEEVEVKSEEDLELKDLEEEEKEIEQISSQIKELEVEEMRNAKRKRKHMLKEQRKLRDKMNLKMVLRGDEGPQLNENIDPEDSLFELKMLKKKKQLALVTDGKPDLLAEDQVERKKSPKVVRFKDEVKDDDADDTDGSSSLDSTLGYSYRRKTSILKKEEGHSSDEEGLDEEGLGLSSEDEGSELSSAEKESESSEESEDEDVEEDEKTEKPIGARKAALITDLDDRPKSLKRQQKAELWFQKDAFKDLEDEEDEDYEISELVTKAREKSKVEGDVAVQNELDKKVVKAKDQKKAKPKEDSDIDSDDVSETDTDSEDETDDEPTENSNKTKPMVKKTSVGGKNGFVVVPAKNGKVKKRKLDAEALALGTVLATSKKARRDVVDMAWNRYCFNDREGLPDWFLEDEKKHMMKDIPVPKDMVEEFKSRERELNVRPIKKVIEAKARKKKRAIRRMEKAKKRVESLMENSEVTEREKARQIKQLYKKATMTKKKEVKYVVAKKFQTGKRGGRPAGHKGLYKVVDPRMKKDMRSMKASSKKGKRSKAGPKFQRPKKGKR
ncbi:pre-rRNA 2'-O-ribose RNA methyltransferase FTSJ3 [Hetaerina americana]|uniref:pre-rRNA 2'-O-ribose RNA methyltransferase FTSJ3 n=1 Tax=Hetaerina americana TaxID=62018 RepID=UPI003A7F18D5